MSARYKIVLLGVLTSLLTACPKPLPGFGIDIKPVDIPPIGLGKPAIPYANQSEGKFVVEKIVTNDNEWSATCQSANALKNEFDSRLKVGQKFVTGFALGGSKRETVYGSKSTKTITSVAPGRIELHVVDEGGFVGRTEHDEICEFDSMTIGSSAVDFVNCRDAKAKKTPEVPTQPGQDDRETCQPGMDRTPVARTLELGTYTFADGTSVKAIRKTLQETSVFSCGRKQGPKVARGESKHFEVSILTHDLLRVNRDNCVPVDLFSYSEVIEPSGELYSGMRTETFAAPLKAN